MEEKLSGNVAVPEWELYCWSPSKVWSTGFTSSSFCSFSYLELVYLVHNMSKLPPRPALTMTGATFSHPESVLLFMSSLIQPKGGKARREKRHLLSDQQTWLAGGAEKHSGMEISCRVKLLRALPMFPDKSVPLGATEVVHIISNLFRMESFVCLVWYAHRNCLGCGSETSVPLKTYFIMTAAVAENEGTCEVFHLPFQHYQQGR